MPDLAAEFLGLTSGMPIGTHIKAFQDGLCGVLGFVGIIHALGTMLGKMMAESVGADQIAQTLIRAFGKDKVQWAMMFAAFLVGIPLFFEIGFVLLIPLVFIVARRTGVSIIKIGIPLLAGLQPCTVWCHRTRAAAGHRRIRSDIGKDHSLRSDRCAADCNHCRADLRYVHRQNYSGAPESELVDQLARENDTAVLPSFSIT